MKGDGKDMMKMHFLKTMWSDIIILQGEKETALIDTGMADQFPMIQTYLDGLGIRDISFILLTHFHRDHYGSIPALLDRYRVGCVYLKEYSGLDRTTAWGTPADDAYRNSEEKNFRDMWELTQQKSRAVACEDLTKIDFEGHEMRLFSVSNSMRTIYEDSAHPETYHQCENVMKDASRTEQALGKGIGGGTQYSFRAGTGADSGKKEGKRLFRQTEKRLRMQARKEFPQGLQRLSVSGDAAEKKRTAFRKLQRLRGIPVVREKRGNTSTMNGRIIRNSL